MVSLRCRVLPAPKTQYWVCGPSQPGPDHLTAESAINSGKLATDVTATDNEKMGRRIDPVQKFIAIDQSRIAGTNIIRARPRSQNDVVRFNFLLPLIFGRNPDSMFIDQCSAPEHHPDLEPFQLVLQLAGQPSAGDSPRLHPLHQRISKQIGFDSISFLFKKFAMESRGCVKSAHGVGPMMKPRATQYPLFDDHHFEAIFCCLKRRLAASRPCTYDRKLIFFIHIASQNYPSLEKPTTPLFKSRPILT